MDHGREGWGGPSGRDGVDRLVEDDGRGGVDRQVELDAMGRGWGDRWVEDGGTVGKEDGGGPRVEDGVDRR